MSDKLDRMMAAFQRQEYEGPSKLCSLQEAVARYVKPGDHIFLSQRGTAGIHEVIRQFWGKDPRFTTSAIMVSHMHFLPAYAGVATKVITALFPAGPSPMFQRLVRSKKVQLERWTILPMILRYMAGASGLPFLPTRSMVGSSVGKELGPGLYTEMDDPLGSGQRVAMVGALRPDVAIVHAVAADPAGNTILVPYWPADCWGARASKRVIVTVEKVVPTETIRHYAPLVTIPAYMVQAVCEVPLGTHPMELLGWVKGIPAYAADSDANRAFGQAVQAGGDALNAWTKEWVLDVPSFEAYREKLGSERVERLQATARDQIAQRGVAFTKEEAAEFTDVEMMAVAAARKIEEVVRKGNYRFIQLGPGLALPATFLAFSSLRADDYDVEMFVAWGHWGFLPQSPAFAGLGNLATPKMYSSMYDMYSAFMRGKDSPSLGILGLTEMDRYGNVNLTRLDDGTELAGGGGHNDVTMGAGEVLVTGRMSARRLRESLNFITTPGERIRTVVTDLGVLQKVGEDRDLSLTSYYAKPGVSEQEAIGGIKKQCGWDLRVAPNVRREPPPTSDELTILRRFMVRRGDAEE